MRARRKLHLLQFENRIIDACFWDEELYRKEELGPLPSA